MRIKCSYDKCIIYTSVSEVLKELFGGHRYKRFSYETGTAIHNRLGFTNDITFRRYYRLDDKLFILLSGTPDRIIPPYVDELKTTVYGRESFVVTTGYLQLQMYMFLVGLSLGRLYIYYKDKNELRLYDIYTYNSGVLDTTLRKFADIILDKNGFRRTIRSVVRKR